VAEGENSFAQLVDNLGTPNQVPNLIFVRKDQILFTKQKTADFDLLPVPSRDLFEVKKYQKAQFSIGVQSKRGVVASIVFFAPRGYRAEMFAAQGLLFQ
jgi:hypothetical protein